MRQIKIDIISGFLGAGKTTLIKKLIKEALFKEKVAIIENEYGEIGIDGDVLREESIQVKEITSGCICCSISGSFESAIEEIVDKYNPMRIIIEPSGVAKLSQIIATLKKHREKGKINSIITVIDVKQFEVYMTNFGEFYIDQIRNAKTVVLSRTQDVDNKHILQVLKGIKKINPGCSVIITPWDKLSGENILEVLEDRRESSLKEIQFIKKPLNNAYARAQIRSEGLVAKDVFETWGQETPVIFEKESLKGILRKLGLGEYGYVLRAKGIVQTSENKWIAFDYVPGEIEVRNISPDYNGRICVIGKDLRINKLQGLFSSEE